MNLSAEIGALPGNDNDQASSSWDGESRADSILEGVRFSSLTERVREFYRVPSEIEGVIVTEVDPGSRAAEAGLVSGEVVTSIGGTEIKNLEAALRARGNVEGDMVVLRVVNANGSRFVAVLDQEG